MRQYGLVEVIANLEARVVLTAQQPLDLQRQISQAGGEKRILAVALQRKSREGTPLRANEVRLRVGGQGAVVQWRERERRAQSLRQSSHGVEVKYDRSEWAGKSGLAGGDFVVTESHHRSARHGYGSGGNIPTAMRHFKAKSIDDFVTLGFVVFYQNRFLALIGDRSSWPYTRPIEDVQVIKAALGLQQVSFFDGLLGWNFRRLCNQ